MRISSRKASLLLAVAYGVMTAIPPAMAQTATAQSAPRTEAIGEEIVVTAQRRAERLLDVPIAISVLNSDALQKAGVGNLQDLERVTPGLALPMYGGFLRPSIRGISSGLSTIGDSSNVAVYVDGVYQPTQTAAIIDMPTVQSVQVLKGPQGTLYGQNATGGAIIIDTMTPSFDTKGEVAMGYGNYNDLTARGYVTGALGSKVAVLLAAAGEDHGGYNKDLLRGGHDKGLRSWQVRGKALLQATDDMSFTVAGYYSKRDDSNVYTGAAFNGNGEGNALTRLLFPGTPIATQPHTFSASFIPDLQAKSYGVSLLGKIDFHNVGRLDTVTAFQHSHVLDLVDVDAAPIRQAEVNPLIVIGKAFVQELNFTSEKFNKFEFSTGLFYMHREERFNPSEFSGYGFIPGFSAQNYTGTSVPDYQQFDYAKTVKNSYAAYLELNYDLTDQLTVTAAGRYSTEKVQAAWRRVLAFASPTFPLPPGTNTTPALDPRGKFTFKKFTPRGVIRYRPNDNHTLYASYSEGFKSGFVDSQLVGSCPGGPNDTSCLPAPVKPETVQAFEVGYKGRLNSNISVTFAAFHYNYKQIQVFIYNPPAGYYQNAAAGRLNGFDIDMAWQVTPELNVALGGSFVDSKYTNFPSASVYNQVPAAGCAAQFLPFPCGSAQSSASATGNQLANAPKFTATIAVDYQHESKIGQFGFNIGGNYNSGFPFDVNGHIRNTKYFLLNSELSFSPAGAPGIRLVVWGKNLTNHDYIQGSLPTTFSDLVSWAPPRTFGVRAEYKF
jgi:iron complex outermembrane receptor protein